MDLGRFWAFLALSSMSTAFSVYPLLSSQHQPQVKHKGFPLSLNWKVSLAMAVRDEPSRTAQQFCFVLKCHPDQSTLWEFLFSGPKCLLPHSSAPKQGRLIPPKFCSFLQQSSFFPHNIHRVQRSRPTFAYFTLNKMSCSSSNTSTDRSFKVPSVSLFNIYLFDSARSFFSG